MAPACVCVLPACALACVCPAATGTAAPLVAKDAGVVNDRGDFAVRVDRQVNVLMNLKVVVGTRRDHPEVVDEAGRERSASQRERVMELRIAHGAVYVACDQPQGRCPLRLKELFDIRHLVAGGHVSLDVKDS